MTRFYSFVLFSISFLLVNFCNVSLAAYWPQFSSPKKDLLLMLNYLDTKNCPPGKAKILSNLKINISNHLCYTRCPSEWEWVITSDNKCHDLSTEFEFQQNDFMYTRDESGLVNESTIIASFGSKNSSLPIAQFIFISPPGEHWYCIQDSLNSEKITCACDI